jgi:serine/threonine-protein kinase
MAITDTLVLPEDVLLTPIAELPATLRHRLALVNDGVALGRARVRASSKVLAPTAASLLQHFRTPSRIADVIVAWSASNGVDPERLLADSFPLLRDCYDARFLVPAGSPDARRIVATIDKGEQVAGCMVLRNIAVLDDTELYQVRGRHGRILALKIARMNGGHGLARRLRHEARVLALLDGRGVPRLQAAGTFEGRPFLLMQWCAGVTPTARARELRALGCSGRPVLLQLLASIARAYARLHERGVLHGDVHGGNLVVSTRGRVTILDFGCSRAAGRRQMPRGVVLPYCDPQLAVALLTGGAPPPLTAAGEQYAIAALLHELATGAAHVGEFPERNPMLRALAHGELVPFASHGAAPWPQLEAVLRRALSRHPRGRFASLRQLAGALPPCAPPPEAPALYQTVAARADHWLRTIGNQSPAEWMRDWTTPRCSVMHGAAGTAFGLYRLAQLRNDAGLLSAAAGWCDLATQWSGVRGAYQNPRRGLGQHAIGAVSPYFGHSGLAIVAGHIAQASGQWSRLSRCISWYCAQDVAAEQRIELGQGIAGALLGAAMLLEIAPPALDDSRRQLAGLGERLMRRLLPPLAALHRFPRDGPMDNAGLTHGWGGVLYAMLRWHRATASQPSRRLGLALATLAQLAEPRGRGVQFPHVPGTGSHHDIPGWCNGPAGLVHLWAIAHQMTGRGRYAELAERCGWSAWEAPDRFPDLCCGLAGRSYALLAVHRVTGDGVWLERARRLMRREAKPFSSTTPGQLSLFKGALGLALLEQDLETPDLACHPFFESEGWPLSVSPSHG